MDVNKIREDFPLLKNRDIIYLDNAATSQKPACVLDAEKRFYEKYNANPFRGLYELSEEATECYEDARKTVADFLHAPCPEEIVFTRNATESLNLAAYTLSEYLLKPGDEIIVSIMEHHSNILPWQQAAKRYGATVKYLECDMDGTIPAERLESMITDRTKIAAITQISNVLGCRNDLKTFAEICHRHGVILVGDGAQSVPHIAVDVQDLGVDFLSFSGHKMLAPMGIGALYGKKELLEKLPPFLTGGEMIESVTREGAVWAEVPHKFEAGTVNAGGAYALAEAVRYMKNIGFDAIEAQENRLTRIAYEGMMNIPGIRVLGSSDPDNHHGILSFAVDGVHPHDVAEILNADNICVRAGHHCAQPLLQYFGTASTTRVSLAFYNTEEEIRAFLESLGGLRRKMGYE